MKGKSRGSIALTMMFVLILIGGLSRVFMVMLIDDISNHREINFCREFLRTGGDLMDTVLSKKAFLYPGKVTLPPFIFTEDSEALTPSVKVDILPKVPLRVVDVTIKGESINWRLRKMFLEPPGGRNHSIYCTQEKLRGSKNSPDFQASRNYQDTKNSSNTKTVFPVLAQKDYTKYQDFFLPGKETLLKEGLSGFVYAEQQGRYFSPYRLPVTGVIRGRGVFYNNDDIVIGAHTSFPDKIWLISSQNIILEDNVRLEEAFLYAKGNISLGQKVRICGIMIAAKGVIKGADAIFQENPKVLDTFVTPSYFY